MKWFIFYSSLQEKAEDYKPMKYECRGDCPEYMEYEETRLPIMPVIASTVEKGETIRVIIVAPDNARMASDAAPGENAAQRNVRWSKEEIEKWASGHNVTCEISVIFYPSSATIAGFMKLLRDLIDETKDAEQGDAFSADMTFGIRTMTMVQLYLLRYIRTIKKNPVDHIVYGQINRNGREITGAELHDVTALFDMESIFSLAGNLRLNDPEKVVDLCLKDLLEDGSPDGEGR